MALGHFAEIINDWWFFYYYFIIFNSYTVVTLRIGIGVSSFHDPEALLPPLLSSVFHFSFSTDNSHWQYKHAVTFSILKNKAKLKAWNNNNKNHVLIHFLYQLPSSFLLPFLAKILRHIDQTHSLQSPSLSALNTLHFSSTPTTPPKLLWSSYQLFPGC